MNESILPRGILITQFIQDCEKLDDTELTSKYGVSHRTLRRWKKKIRDSEHDIALNAFPTSTSPIYNDYLKVNYAKVLVIGDAEIPDHDPEIFEMAVRVADSLGIAHLIINGDFMALDAFSRWPKDNMQSVNFRRDVRLAVDSIKLFLNSFDTVDYIVGNHEQRLARQNNGQIDVSFYFSELDMQYSNYKFCELTSGEKEILICHPEDYSRVPLAVPRRLATVYHKNILCGHTHRLALGKCDAGKYWIAEGGHARSPERTLYKAMKVASYPMWNAGFTIIIDGNIYLIDRDNFDFWAQRIMLLARKH